MSRGSGRVRSGLVLIASLVCFVLSLKVLWKDISYESEAFEEGRFEEGADGVFLRLVTATMDTNLGLTDPTQDNSLELEPGNAYVFPLSDGARYQVTSPDPTRPPYVVFGNEMAEERGSQTFSPRRMGNTQVLDPAEGSLDWISWRPDRPWPQDRAWLDSLAARCGEGAEAAGFLITVEDRSARVNLGTCAASLPLSNSAVGRPLLTVLPGPDWAVVERLDRSWPVVENLNVSGLIAIAVTGVLIFALLFSAGGIPTIMVLSVIMLVLSMWQPSWSVAMAALCFLVGLAGSGWKGIRFIWRRSRSAVFGLAVCAVFVVCGLLMQLEARVEPDPRRALITESEPRCQVLGYSNVYGVSLEDSNQGCDSQLNQNCPECRAATNTRAWIGGTFHSVARFLCERAGDDGLEHVVFLGGSNDDLMWWLMKPGPTQPARFLLAALSVGLGADSSPEQLTDMLDHAAELSLADGADQQRLIRSALACTQANGAQFLYVHIFMPSDLEGGRSAARQQLLELRREAVEEAGGHFVDLLSTVRDEAGVSWFNDIIHLSAVGHRRASEVICHHLSGTSPADR